MSVLPKNGLISGRKLRSWWAMQSQKRRRHGAAAPLPPFPVVTLSNGIFYGESNWFDTAFDVAVNLKTWSAANLEIWLNPWDEYVLLAIVPSSTVRYVHFQASYGEGTFMYKARYRTGHAR